MKSLFKNTLLLIVLLVGINYSAQELSFGAKAGFSYAMVSNDGGSGIGYHAGGLGEYQLNDDMALRAELLYSARPQTTKSVNEVSFFGITTKTTTESKLNTNYIEIPLLFKYNVNETFGLFGGLQFSYLLSNSGTFKTTTEITDLPTKTNEFNVSSKEGMNTLLYGIALGAEYMFAENMGVDLKFGMDLNTINNSSSAKSKFSVLQASFVYKF